MLGDFSVYGSMTVIGSVPPVTYGVEAEWTVSPPTLTVLSLPSGLVPGVELLFGFVLLLPDVPDGCAPVLSGSLASPVPVGAEMSPEASGATGSLLSDTVLLPSGDDGSSAGFLPQPVIAPSSISRLSAAAPSCFVTLMAFIHILPLCSCLNVSGRTFRRKRRVPRGSFPPKRRSKHYRRAG